MEFAVPIFSEHCEENCFKIVKVLEKVFDPIVPGLHALAQMKREPLSPGFTVEIDLLY